MKKILLSAFILLLPIISNANPNNPRFFITSLNKTEAFVRVGIDKPFPFVFDMEGMRGITFHIDSRMHVNTTFPFKLTYKKSTGNTDEFTVIIGKEYESLRCIEYEFTIEVYEDSHPEITYAGCKGS